VDDEPLRDGGDGWVTTFTKCLKIKLNQLLGRPDAYTWWIDHELHGGQQITPEILEKVRRSAMLLVILSPGYAASEWCRLELDTFAGFIARGEGRSIFIVDRCKIDDTVLSSPVRDVKRSRFWTEDPMTRRPRTVGDPEPDRAYFDAVTDLSMEIVAAVKEMRRGASRSAAPAPLASNGTVFLAEVTDDLDEQRNNVRRYLDQAGIAVLPKDTCSLRPDAFRQAVKEGLAAADLFVQLLSEIPGKRPADMPEGYAKCQLELALSLGKPVLQWRSAALDMATVEDNIQHALLDAPTVRAEGIEDFKRGIRRYFDDRLKPPAPPASVDAFVFVDMQSTDRQLALELCDILDRCGAGYVLPCEDPRKFRKELKQKVSECNALILIYSATTRSWVEDHQRELLKMLTARPRPLRAKALVVGPPDPKDRLLIKLPGMQTIDCPGRSRRGRDKAVLADPRKRSSLMMLLSPYPGLRPFEVKESHLFFGREEQIDELLHRLHTARFLAVVGPSGCGKSSLVRAGMIAALGAGFMVDAGPR
jgi:hypothetical protein